MKFLKHLFQSIWIICVSVPTADYVINHTNMPNVWTSLMYLIFLISCSVMVNTLE